MIGRKAAIRIAAVLAAAVVGAGWIAAAHRTQSNDRYSAVAPYIASERTIYYRLPGSSAVMKERIVHLKGLEFDAAVRLLREPLRKDGFVPTLLSGDALEPQLNYECGNDHIMMIGPPWFCSEGIVIEETADASSWELAAARLAQFGRDPVIDHRVPPLPSEVLP